jgi:hypothetical protein
MDGDTEIQTSILVRKLSDEVQANIEVLNLLSLGIKIITVVPGLRIEKE